MMRKFTLCVALLGTWLGGLTAIGRAQDPILAQLYGSGVHEYFSGNAFQAIKDLSEAIDNKSKDPRVYYFRALAWLRVGDTTKAQADFTAGAKMESADIDGYYPVSKSLERVQGSARLTLERYRVQARAETYRRQEKRNLVRYEQQRRAEAEVLRATPPPPEPGDTTPAATPEKPAEAPAADAPAEAPDEMGAGDPFADESDSDAAAMPEKSDDAATEEKPAGSSDDDAAAPEDEMPADSGDEMSEEDSK
jgi:tetratricopeptide (TPR) repeat protein